MSHRQTTRRRRGLATIVATTLVATLLPLTAASADVQARDIRDACPPSRVPDAGFNDIEGNTHEEAIECVAWYDVAQGTSASSYSPRSPVTREQMASFLVRVLDFAEVDLPQSPRNHFPDDDSSSHHRNINILAELGIAQGSADRNDYDNDGDTEELIYEPKNTVRRDQMTSFLNRTYAQVSGSQKSSDEDFFTDDNDSPHEPNINALASVGIATGRGGTTFDPSGVVTRDAMASFIARTLDLLVEEGFIEPPINGLFDIVLDRMEVQQGRAVSGEVIIAQGDNLNSLRVRGCGLAEQELSVNAENEFSFAIPGSQPVGPCELEFIGTVNGVRDSEVVLISVTESDTVLDNPELVSTTVRTVGEDRVTIRLTFDEAILSAIDISSIELIDFGAEKHPAITAERVGPTEIDAVWSRDVYDRATTVSVGRSAVQDQHGFFNAEAAQPLQSQTLDEGATNQPDLLSVQALAPGSTFYRFTYDQVALNAHENVSNRYFLVLTNGSQVQSTQSTGDNSAFRDVSFPADQLVAPVARGYVQAGTVKAPETAGTNARQAANVRDEDSQGTTPHLRAVSVDVDNQAVIYTFDQAVSGVDTAGIFSDEDPLDSNCCNSDRFHLYYVDGSEATSNEFEEGPGNLSITVFFDADITQLVAGGSVDPNAVTSDATGNANLVDEAGRVLTFAEGETSAPDLTAVRKEVLTDEVVIVWVFDQDIVATAPGSTPASSRVDRGPDFHLYRPDGTRFSPDGSSGSDFACSASEREFICRTVAGDAQYEFALESVYASVEKNAVVDTTETFGNYAAGLPFR